MNQQKERKVFLEEDDAIRTIQNQKNHYTKYSSLKSGNNKKYIQFFSDIATQKIEDLQFMHQKLKQNGFTIGQNQTQIQLQKPLFQMKIYQKTQNWQIIQIDCKLGIYQKKFLGFNTMHSKTHQLKFVSNGTIGDVYSYTSQRGQFAIKCICSKNGLFKNEEIAVLGIKQYFIACMMSVLEIGPRVKAYAGFDIIFSEHCLQFSMELCLNFQQIEFTLIHQINIKILLKKLHLLKIVHLDIKPSNIMFSKQFSKIVFIDFGLSNLILQSPGSRTLTSFKGTAAYSGQQMKKCISSRQQKLVDLYLNDIQSLNKTFNVFKSRIQENVNVSQYQTNQSLPLSKKILKHTNLILIKFHIVLESLQKVTDLLKNDQQKNNLNLQRQILIFLTYLRHSHQYRKFGQSLSFLSKKTDQYIIFKMYYKKDFFIKQTAIDSKSKLLTSQNHIVFKTMLQKLNNYSSSCDKLICKQSFYRILIKEKQQVEIQKYVSAYIQYSSFSKNIFKTSMKQKFQVSVLFLEKYRTFITDQQIIQFFPNFNNQDQSQLVSNQLRNIIKCIKICMSIVEKNINNKYFNNFYFDLLEETVLLKIGYFKFQDTFFYKIMKIQQKYLYKIKACLKFYLGLNFMLDLKRVAQPTKQTLQNIKKVLQKFYQLESQIINLSQKRIHEMVINYLNLIVQNSYQIYHSETKKYFCLIQQVFKSEILYLTAKQHLHFIQILSNLMQINMKIGSIYFSEIRFKKLLQKDIYFQYEFYIQKQQQKLLKLDIIRINYYYSMKNTSKTKQAIRIFQEKINCQQISDMYFKEKRLHLAMNSQNKIKFVKIIQSIFIQNIQLDIKQNIIMAIGCFSQYRLIYNFFIIQNQSYYDKIKNWMKSAIQNLTKKYIKVQNKNKIELVAAFHDMRWVLHAFYQLIQRDIKYQEKQKNFFLQIHQKFLSLYQNVADSLKCQNQYIQYMLQYFRLQKDLKEQINFILNLKILDFNWTNNEDINITLLQRIFSIQKQLQPKFKYNLFKYKDIYEILATKYKSALLLTCQQFQYYIISLSQLKNYDRLNQFFLDINAQLLTSYDQIKLKRFMCRIKHLKQILNCKCKFCKGFMKQDQTLSALLVESILKLEINPILHPYFSVILSLYLLQLNQQQHILKKVVIFVAKSFQYLDNFTKSQLLQNYYRNKLKLCELQSPKYYLTQRKEMKHSNSLQFDKFKSNYLRKVKFNKKDKNLQLKNKFEQKVLKLWNFIKANQKHELCQQQLQKHKIHYMNLSIQLKSKFSEEQRIQLNIKFNQKLNEIKQSQSTKQFLKLIQEKQRNFKFHILP